MNAPQEREALSNAALCQRERWADLMGLVAEHKDRSAFAELFSFFAPRVKAYLMRLGAGTALSEEIAQEVMVTVWRKAHMFDREQAAVSTWIFRIARNRRIDAARRLTSAQIDYEDPSLLPPPAPSPDAGIDALEIETRVRDAISTLPEEQLDLLRLAFYEGLSHREIADRRDLPLGTVKSRIRLAFNKLRGKLDDMG